MRLIDWEACASAGGSACGGTRPATSRYPVLVASPVPVAGDLQVSGSGAKARRWPSVSGDLKVSGYQGAVRSCSIITT